MNPLLLLLLVGGGGYLYLRSKKTASATSSTPEIPARADTKIDAAELGFKFPDCNHMMITDQANFMATVQSVVNANAGSLWVVENKSADFNTRQFFSKYFPTNCGPLGNDPTRTIRGPIAGQTDAVIPSKAPVPQQIMYAVIYTVVAGYLNDSNIWTDEQTMSILPVVLGLPKSTGLTEEELAAASDEVFKGSVTAAAQGLAAADHSLIRKSLKGLGYPVLDDAQVPLNAAEKVYITVFQLDWNRVVGMGLATGRLTTNGRLTPATIAAMSRALDISGDQARPWVDVARDIY